MGRALRLALAALGLLVVASLLPRGGPRAAHADEPKCTCQPGVGACQHFLKNPAGPTDDPCWCERCGTGQKGRRHDGSTVPPGWNAECFTSTRLACYLKRHAAAWGIHCSECFRLGDCCPFENKARCPDCDATSERPTAPKDTAGRDARAQVADRLAKERRHFKDGDEVVLAYSRNFYLVTDLEGLKVRMPGGIPRPISKHEWLHLMLERAEWCRREFVRALGEPMMQAAPSPGAARVTLPMAMYFVARERDKQNLAEAYFNAPLATYKIGAGSRPADGMCVTGMGFSEERYGGDHDLQVQMRHQIAHNLFSCWARPEETRPNSLPQWIYEGLGHWMTKLTKPFEDDATTCIREGAQSGSPTTGGKGWDKDVAKLAASTSLDPIEKLLGKTVKGELTAEDHKRSWSLVSLGISDLGKPFADLLADLRKERDLREAFVARIAMTPEEFDRRWRERVLGKRKSLAETEGAAAGAAPGTPPKADPAAAARERASIRNEQDPRTLAAKIRQQGAIADPDMIEVVVDMLARRSDLVRETALVTLLKTKDEAARKRLREYGLSHGEGYPRAYTARVCGRLGIADAGPRLVELLEDSSWIARAEAAVALGRLKHAPALPALRKMVASDTSGKAQVGAMDALAHFGKDAEMAIPLVAKHLAAPAWQLRVTAAQTLGAIPSMEAVEPLVARMEVEGGRVREAIRDALKAITRDDLGMRPENWRAWWDREKERHKGKLPPRPDAPAAGTPKADDRYAAPKYYGVELFSDRVAFVVDTSGSMKLLFDPDPAAAKVLSRVYTGHDKLTICREEVAQALKSLEPRSHFLVVTFGTQIRSYKPNPVPASPSNIEGAISFLQSIPASGETNYYDALKAALDLGDEPDQSPDFRSTPDTISFLTDGEPTAGDVTDGDALVEWYTGLNRYARIETHTITFGLHSVDQIVLRRLAEQNWGRYTLVPERGKAPR